MLHNLIHYTFEKKWRKICWKIFKKNFEIFSKIVFWIQINIFDHRKKGAVWFALLRPPKVSSKICIIVQWFSDYLWIPWSDSDLLFWSHMKILNIEQSRAVFQKKALKSVKLSFNSVWIAEYSYILSKKGFGALNFWNFHSGSKPVGQNHFKESTGSPKITVW